MNLSDEDKAWIENQLQAVQSHIKGYVDGLTWNLSPVMEDKECIDAEQIRQLHDKAMEYTDTAMTVSSSSGPEQAKEYYYLAMRCEKEAAELVPLYSEPTRAVLFRSAAQLALDSGEPMDAAVLVAKAFMGRPPNDLRIELMEVLKQVEEILYARHGG